VLEKRKSFLINFAYFAVIAALAVILLRYGMKSVGPFAIAAVIAWAVQRPVRFFESRLPFNKRLCAALTVVLFYALAGFLVALVSTELVTGFVMLIKSLPTIYETKVFPFFVEVFHNVEATLVVLDADTLAVLEGIANDFLDSLGSMVSSISVWAMGLVTSIAGAVPGLFIKLVVMIISTFFIAMDYDRLTGFCLRQMDEGTRNLVLQIKEYLVGTLWVCIRSYALIMSITCVELCIGLSLLKIDHAVLVAVLISIFDILPVLGTGGIMIPWVLLTLVQGNFARALGLLAVYIVITVIRNIIEPKIVGSQLGLHPVVTLCSMFVGAQVLGVVGLFGFPIGLSLLRYLNDHGVIKIFR